MYAGNVSSDGIGCNKVISAPFQSHDRLLPEPGYEVSSIAQTYGGYPSVILQYLEGVVDETVAIEFPIILAMKNPFGFYQRVGLIYIPCRAETVRVDNDIDWWRVCPEAFNCAKYSTITTILTDNYFLTRAFKPWNQRS